jgi:SAM-dependent methyltransferase
MADPDYIHTFSAEEQRRLIHQAEVLEPFHHAGLDLSGCRRILEIGCGVGAQMRILLRRWPQAEITGIDRSAGQIAKAREVLADALAGGRAALHEGPAEHLPFASGTFDAVCVFWVFEHLPNPKPVLAEALRVLRPGGRIWITEVFDRALYAFPPCPHMAAYFAAFTGLQKRYGGDPDIGVRLPGLLARAGFTRIEARDVSPLVDARLGDPAARARLLDYFRDLLLSAAGQLRGAGAVPGATVDGMVAEFEALKADPDAVFHYGAKQAAAHKPG